MLGYAFTGSFGTLSRSLETVRGLVLSGYEVQPIMSPYVYTANTRFTDALTFRGQVEAITGHSIIHTVEGAEPLGPKTPLEALIIAPCTGNTLAKIANGITDTAVTKAVAAVFVWNFGVRGADQ